mgnify:CR=1 FL=1
MSAAFQSTRPRRARPIVRVPFVSIATCFNPRAREGRDFTGDETSPEVYVSIHAPAKGATLRAEKNKKNWLVSIHAPAKGAT